MSTFVLVPVEATSNARIDHRCRFSGRFVARVILESTPISSDPIHWAYMSFLASMTGIRHSLSYEEQLVTTTMASVHFTVTKSGKNRGTA
jgi:hypothetical protein